MNSTSEQRPPSWTITRLLDWTKDHLARNRVEDARLAAEVLLAHALGCSRIDLYTKFDQVPAQEELDRFRGWVKRAGEGEPIAYLVEEKEFFSLSSLLSDPKGNGRRSYRHAGALIDFLVNTRVEGVSGKFPELLDKARQRRRGLRASEQLIRDVYDLSLEELEVLWKKHNRIRVALSKNKP